ncbi:trypsin domain protein [Archangium gephyra]|uniref:Trypsin domain protein n=1 Tax=Archangium gephyra TaxID=48 RepID=A0AAC8TF92_9BACT|nr:trypsin domain protein [Archangium gephyra]
MSGCTGSTWEQDEENTGQPQGTLQAAATTATGSLATGRSGFTATPLLDGRVLIVGGVSDGGRPLTAEIYSPTTGQFSLAGWLTYSRYWHTATRLADGRVLVVGGASTASAEIFDPVTGTWSQTGTPLQGRSGHTATLLRDGRVLVTGGGLGQSCEFYNPTTGTWSSAPSLLYQRSDHTATLLADGRVLVIGGAIGSNIYDTNVQAEIFNPATNTWSLTGQPVDGRQEHRAYLLHSGKVLVVGGEFNRVYLWNSELYDPATGSFSARVSAPNSGRFGGGVTRLGQVLIAGGGSTGTNSVSRYDPATNTWTALGSMLQPRQLFEIAELPDHRFLITGGNYGYQTTTYNTISELYDDGSACEPATCAASGAVCGSISDGCGGTLNCGTCPGGQICSASNTCEVCVPTTCESQGRVCGSTSDGCGGTLECGTCADGMSCLGGACITPTPPTVSFTSPTEGSTVEGNVTLAVNAASSFGLSRVEFYLGTALLGTDTSAPFTQGLNTRAYANGTQTLTARAYDTLGTQGSAGISVTFNNDFNAPTVSMTSPAQNAILTAGNAYVIRASASDDRGVRQVEFYLDGALISTRQAPYEVTWTPSSSNVGGHTWFAKAYDLAGNVTTSASVSVTVQSPPTSPNSLPYSASNTNSAQQNTVNRIIALSAGQTLTLGTCGVTGSSFSGDTYLRLYNSSGVQVALSDDACGGAGSNFTYTVPSGAGGNYQLRAGCYSSYSCSGTVAWTTTGSTTPPPSGSTLNYSASNTNSAQQATVNQTITLTAGQTLTLGTCGVTGSSFSGDTYLRLYNSSGVEVAYNDDACGGTGSNFTYTVPSGAGGNYQLRAGCFSSNSCSGTAAWTLQ